MEKKLLILIATPLDPDIVYATVHHQPFKDQTGITFAFWRRLLKNMRLADRGKHFCDEGATCISQIQKRIRAFARVLAVIHHGIIVGIGMNIKEIVC